jgi:hypothetical protein
LGNLENEQMNWRFRGVQVGPTIQLRQLLARINSLLHDFHNGIGVRDRKLMKEANSLGF